MFKLQSLTSNSCSYVGMTLLMAWSSYNRWHQTVVLTLAWHCWWQSLPVLGNSKQSWRQISWWPVIELADVYWKTQCLHQDTIRFVFYTLQSFFVVVVVVLVEYQWWFAVQNLLQKKILGRFSSSVPWLIGSSGGTWGMIQQRSSPSLFCRKLLWAVLAWAEMSTLWCCPSSITAYHAVGCPPRYH